MLRQAQHDIVAVTLSLSKGNHVSNHGGVVSYFNSIGDNTNAIKIRKREV
jgi:preprotein translocase subunit YajC